MSHSRKKSKGFTLVELAIVITIIGLLIGGVLKGQELLENARMTSMASKFKGITAAVITFKDLYKALPGDMIGPGNVLPNCSAAPCNVSGNGNGQVGTDNFLFEDENARFWLHLAKTNLISGVDANGTWTGANYWATTMSYPVADMGGVITMFRPNQPAGATYPNGFIGHSYLPAQPYGTNVVTEAIPLNKIAKYDLKADDGKPFTGDVAIYTACSLAPGATAYNANDTTKCFLMSLAGF